MEYGVEDRVGSWGVLVLKNFLRKFLSNLYYIYDL